MKHIKRSILFFLLSSFCFVALKAQNTIPVAGGNSTGAGGTVSYSVGQVICNTLSGTNGTVAHGVQQPYEISIVTAIENTEGITLEYKVYPNPTTGSLKLIIKPFDNENFKYRLYDLNGILLKDNKVDREETEISFENFSPSMYLLKVIKDNQEIKIFKIIKR